MADDCSNTTPSVTNQPATRDEFATAFRQLNHRLLRKLLLGFGLPITAGWLVMMVAGTLAEDGRVPPTAGLVGAGFLICALGGVIIPIVRHEAAGKKLAPHCQQCGQTSLQHASFMITTGCCPECGMPLFEPDATQPRDSAEGVSSTGIGCVVPPPTGVAMGNGCGADTLGVRTRPPVLPGLAALTTASAPTGDQVTQRLLTRAQLEAARLEESRIVKRHMLIHGGITAVATAATILVMMQTGIWYQEGLINPPRYPWRVLPVGVAVRVFGVGFIAALRRGITAQIHCPACGQCIAGIQFASRLGCCMHCGERIVADPILAIDGLPRDDSQDSDPLPLLTREEYRQRRTVLMQWHSRWGIPAALAAIVWFLVTIVVGSWLTSPSLPRQELEFGTLAIATLGAVFPLIVIVRAHTKLAAGLRCPACRSELARSYLVLMTRRCCSCGRTVIRDDPDAPAASSRNP